MAIWHLGDGDISGTIKRMEKAENAGLVSKPSVINTP